jgi:hypothetical protein
METLEERFAPPNQTELYRVPLTERRQKPTESLPELGQAIRRLVNLAYPTGVTVSIVSNDIYPFFECFHKRFIVLLFIYRQIS